MSALLETRQIIRNFINKYEAYVKPVGKLFVALLALILINGKLGYMDKIDNVAIVLIVALMCSFMPSNFIVLVSGLFIVAHMYALSLECCIVVLVIFLVLFLLYLRFSPKDMMVVVLTPICCAMGIPYVIPVAMGLLGGPYSVISVACGLVAHFTMKSITGIAPTLEGMESDDMATRLRLVVDAIMDNKAMLVMIIAFAITIIAVYVIKNLSINFAWPIAIISGAIIDAIIMLICVLATDAEVSVAGIILGTLLAVVVGFVLQFLFFNVDYNHVEKVSFEDDDYVYYVKAVPKVGVSKTSRSSSSKGKKKSSGSSSSQSKAKSQTQQRTRSQSGARPSTQAMREERNYYDDDEE